MAKIKIVTKRVRMDVTDIIKFQIITYCYINHISVTESDLKCLTLLAVSNAEDLTKFCIEASEKKIFKSTQTVRNCIVKLEKMNLITKDGRNRKVELNPELNVQVNGNILLDYKIMHLDTKET